MTEFLNEWQFLAAIANSPKVIKSWEYSSEQAFSCCQTLRIASGASLLSADLNAALTFCDTFLTQFRGLNAEQRQQILQILAVQPNEEF